MNDLGMLLEQQVIEIEDYYYHKIIAPKTWAEATLSDVCQIVGGSQPPKKYFISEPKEGHIRLIQIRDYKTDKFATYIPTELAKRFCNTDDIMIGRYGPPIFQILRGLEGAYNVALMKAVPSEELIDKEFLYNFLKSPHLFNYVAAASLRTAGQDGVRKEHLNNYPFFVPPLNEQRRIVKKIEALTARSRKAREALEAIPELLDQFRQSVLAAAFRGDLTADWREQNPDVEPAEALLERIRGDRRKRWEEFEFARMKARDKLPKNSKWKSRYNNPDSPETDRLPDIPSTWQWVKLSSLCIEIGDVDHKMPKAQSEGIPYVSPRDFQVNGEIDFHGAKKISEDDYLRLCKKIYPEKGDILLSRYGTVGAVRLIKTEQPFQASYSIAILKVVAKPLSQFMSLGLASEVLQSQIRFWSRGVTQADLGLKHIKEFAFPIPPLDEQIEIVSRVKSIMTSIKSIEALYEDDKTELEQLDQSILAKAFRGELVPQDPNDEPAAVLLERIRAERVNSKGKIQNSKRRKQK